MACREALRHFAGALTLGQQLRRQQLMDAALRRSIAQLQGVQQDAAVSRLVLNVVDPDVLEIECFATFR